MSLAPSLLLSMPQLLDPNFARSVVLLCEHGPGGAFGLIVNRPADISAAEAVQLDPPVSRSNDLSLRFGGPVEPQRGWILTAQPLDDDDQQSIGAGLYLSSSAALLRRVIEAPELPARTMVLAGYAGWGPGQLDAELAASAWLIGSADVDLIFDVPAKASWEMAIRRLGADPHLLQPSHGVH